MEKKFPTKQVSIFCNLANELRPFNALKCIEPKLLSNKFWTEINNMVTFFWKTRVHKQWSVMLLVFTVYCTKCHIWNLTHYCEAPEANVFAPSQNSTFNKRKNCFLEVWFSNVSSIWSHGRNVCTSKTTHIKFTGCFLFFYFLHLSAWKSISNVSITTKSNSITL